MAKEIIGSEQHDTPYDDLYLIAVDYATRLPGVVPSRLVFGANTAAQQAADAAAASAAAAAASAALFPPVTATQYLRGNGSGTAWETRTAAQTRADLGISIGVNVQPFDTDLTAIAALASAADKVPYATGAGTWALADFTAAGRALLDDANVTAQRATLGLTIGTNVQAFDADLAAIAALTSAADQLPYATGTGTWAMTTMTAAARTVLDDTTVAAMRTTLGAYASAGGDLSGLVSQSGGAGLVIGSTSLFTSVNSGGAIAPSLQVLVAGAANALIGRWGASASAPALNFFKSRNASVGSHTVINTGDQIGAVSFAASDGTVARDAGRFVVSSTGAPTANGVPARWDWITYDGTTSFVSLGLAPTGDVQVNQVNVITQARHIQLRSYTAGTLPSAATAGQEIYVSDAPSGLRHAVSDGSVWRLDNGQDASQAAINAQTGTTYTLALTDLARTVEMNNASANTLTVPLNATVAFPIGTRIRIIQTGAGKTTIAAAGGVILNSTGGLLSIAAQWSEATLFKRAGDSWVLTGSLIA